jgi:isopentenyl-diphosphate delta-isomerase
MPAPSSDSMIDVVDDNDRPFDTVRRGDALPAAVNFRTVHVLVFDHAGRLLLQRLASTRERHAGLWGSSVAGYLHAGESYEQAASRRLEEELGIVAPLDPIGVLRMRDEQSSKFVGVFTTTADRAMNMLPDHIAELRWFTIDELRDGLAATPDAFTETFRNVFAYWWQAQLKD